MSNLTLDDDFVISNPRFGGFGYFAGISPGLVTVNGTPARRRIFAIERSSMLIVSGCWSNSNGTWRIGNLDADRKYLLIALDHQTQYEPVAWDWVSPAVDTNG